MQLENSFTVPVPIDDAWRVLLDIERIAPCMPGAVLDSVTGDEFTGRVKVKLGPINLTYQGRASFVEKDGTAHRAVIDAKGKDQRGNGTAAATITATLAAQGSTTRVDVLTDLNITGRPAQFGRGVMTDVGNKLLGQFADKLAAQLGSAGGDVQVDQEAAATSQEPTVAKATAAAAAKAAATTAGVVEEVAASAETSAGEAPAGDAVTKVAAAARKTAAAAADAAASAEETAAEAPATAATAPAKAAKAAPAKAAKAARSTVAPAAETPAATEGAARGAVPDPTAVPAKKAPSAPPSGTTAPPNRPAGAGPARSTPVRSTPAKATTAAASSAPSTTAPVTPPAPRRLSTAEPEPIDLLEVAGTAAFTRYAGPAAGLGVLLLLIALLVRRRRHS
ncbi:SRPBCC family protein [Modestobacter marinus]|uniref:SRPBCC family protein n=1 Tax=Modestobacter marinus TaxID=477641 RepID=UPI001C96AC65|nr:SRPBCC family protein [Modestobacter marinus]